MVSCSFVLGLAGEAADVVALPFVSRDLVRRLSRNGVGLSDSVAVGVGDEFVAGFFVVHDDHWPMRVVRAGGVHPLRGGEFVAELHCAVFVAEEVERSGGERLASPDEAASRVEASGRCLVGDVVGKESDGPFKVIVGQASELVENDRLGSGEKPCREGPGFRLFVVRVGEVERGRPVA